MLASSRSIVEYVLVQLGPDATAKPMFGEYGIYFRGTLIGLLCDDRLFLKPTEAASQLLGEHERDAPYPGAKLAIVVPEDLWDERSLMRRLALATAEALAKPQPSSPTKRRTRKTNAASSRVPRRR
jgi:TfoX/Sxy family transcriptional regulator of competence genes